VGSEAKSQVGTEQTRLFRASWTAMPIARNDGPGCRENMYVPALVAYRRLSSCLPRIVELLGYQLERRMARRQGRSQMSRNTMSFPVRRDCQIPNGANNRPDHTKRPSRLCSHGTLSFSTEYMASRNLSRQSGPKRSLQTGESRKANCPSAGPSIIIDPALQTSSSAQPFRDSDDMDVHTFKGKLLGAEDGLIDALINDPPPRRRLIGETPARTSTGSFHRNSQSNFERLKAGLLGVDDRLVDAVALLAAQDADRPANLRTPGLLLSCGWLTAPQFKGFDERCSISDGHTAAHHTWGTCAVAVGSDEFGHDDGVTDESLANGVGANMQVEPSISDCQTLAAEGFCVPSLLTKAPELPKTESTDDLIMDSVMFDTPPNSSLLGAENLDDWQAFGSWQAFDSTVSDLLATWD
jgi:hypothetical protein